jgi:hypothetical protein
VIGFHVPYESEGTPRSTQEEKRNSAKFEDRPLYESSDRNSSVPIPGILIILAGGILMVCGFSYVVIGHPTLPALFVAAVGWILADGGWQLLLCGHWQSARFFIWELWKWY